MIKLTIAIIVNNSSVLIPLFYVYVCIIAVRLSVTAELIMTSLINFTRNICKSYHYHQSYQTLSKAI